VFCLDGTDAADGTADKVCCSCVESICSNAETPRADVDDNDDTDAAAGGDCNIILSNADSPMALDDVVICICEETCAPTGELLELNDGNLLSLSVMGVGRVCFAGKVARQSQ
jgi:hypothetical protein